jgi:hypothetical protein
VGNLTFLWLSSGDDLTKKIAKDFQLPPQLGLHGFDQRAGAGRGVHDHQEPEFAMQCNRHFPSRHEAWHTDHSHRAMAQRYNTTVSMGIITTSLRYMNSYVIKHQSNRR